MARNGMPDHLCLFTNGQVRLAIFIVFEPIVGRIFAVFPRLQVEVMWLRPRSSNEVGSQFQIAWIVRRMIELDQCQLDFGMSAISGFFTGLMAEGLIDMICIAG